MMSFLAPFTPVSPEIARRGSGKPQVSEANSFLLTFRFLFAYDDYSRGG
jgi:hypothetical protein